MHSNEMKGSHDLSSFSATNSELGESHESDGVLQFINHIFMEEELDRRGNISQDALALQVLEKSFYDALGQDYPSSPPYKPPFDSDPDITNTNFVTFQSVWPQKSSTFMHSNEMKGSNDLSPFSATNSERDLLGESYESDAVLKVINKILIEEELDSRAIIAQDALALQVLEKSFYDALGQDYPSSLPYKPPSDGDSDIVNKVSTSILMSQSTTVLNCDDHFDWGHGDPIHPLCSQSDFRSPSDGHDTLVNPSDSSVNILPVCGLLSCCDHNDDTLNAVNTVEKLASDYSSNGSRGIKNREREDIDYIREERSSKHSAVYFVETELSDMFDKVLLGDGGSSEEYEAKKKIQESGHLSKCRSISKRESVDLTTLLTQCAEAVASWEQSTAYELLKTIRKHSSPFGDPSQRLVHCFANGFEARLAGNKGQRYEGCVSPVVNGTPSSDFLKSYHVLVSTFPFIRASHSFANRTIESLSMKEATLHIIDFGILYGFQWPFLLQCLSKRPGGPPRLRITAIELPKAGFRPSYGVEDTGRCLAYYCRRFNIPFEYSFIAQKWETIRPEDLNIVKDEFLVVNCLYRFGYLLDYSVVGSSPRDTVLELIRSINPNVFIHGVVNGNYSIPFFMARFREALYHFSTIFDMLDAILPRDDEARMLFETVIFGSDVMNVIACEGTERFDRPESYKSWHLRHQRAGFRRIPLNQDIVKEIRAKVKLNHHKEFMVEENSHWVLLAWKGRIMQALSCWKPA